MFPSLPLAYEAGKIGGTMPCVLNGANEVAVYAFLRKAISFTCIFEIVRTVMERHKVVHDVSLDAIRQADAWARREAASLVEKGV